jgi:hypothetical protein
VPLDAKGRKRRAAKAAKVLAKKRRENTLERDKAIVLAYAWLNKSPQTKADAKKAIQFLIGAAGSPNLPEGAFPLRHLAEATGLTRQRIWQIVNKAAKAPKAAPKN